MAGSRLNYLRWQCYNIASSRLLSIEIHVLNHIFLRSRDILSQLLSTTQPLPHGLPSKSPRILIIISPTTHHREQPSLFIRWIEKESQIVLDFVILPVTIVSRYVTP